MIRIRSPPEFAWHMAIPGGSWGSTVIMKSGPPQVGNKAGTRTHMGRLGD